MNSELDAMGENADVFLDSLNSSQNEFADSVRETALKESGI